MKTFTFYTKDGFRQDVKASSARSAWNKINSLPNFRERFSGTWGQYDKDGLLPAGQVDGKFSTINK